MTHMAGQLGRATALVAALLLAAPAAAHEIPARVRVVAFVRPDGTRLRVIVRVPLEAMRDLDFPLRGPGYLDLARIGPVLHDATRLWIAGYLEVYEDGTRLGDPEIVAARVSLPSDRSFGAYSDAVAHLTGPALPADTDLVWQQALLDVMLEYRIRSDRSGFAIQPTLGQLGLRTTTVLRFLPPGGAERVFQYTGDPGRVGLDPRWHQAALRFVRLGFLHILDGIDHLLFILGLIIPFRRVRPLIAIVTSFTVAHSITLVASALGLAPNTLWFPPLIETLIALSIVFMAFENIVGPKLQRRWLIAFAFGLVHGFGFSFVLRDSLQFAGGHLATGLLGFNLGVELGQLLVLLLAIPTLNWLFRHGVAERMGTILLSALVAHTAWHWMADRAAELRRFRFQWPALDLALLAGLMRGLMLVLLLVGTGWLLFGLFRRLLRPSQEGEPRPDTTT